MKELIEQYRDGSIGKKDFSKSLPKFIVPLFEASETMKGLNMCWIIDGTGIVADIDVDIPHAEKKVEVKLCLSSTDMSQIPYGYLANGYLPESEEFQIFFSLLGEKGTFLDIGANEGWYSLLAALYGARVYSFEPIEETYQRLAKNIMLNNLTEIRPFHMGLGEKEGTEQFYYHRSISGASSRANLDYYSDGSAQKIECPMDTLDHVRAQEQIEKIDLIKCDVEGGELFVYRGGRETIRRFRPFVLSEMLRKWSAKFHYHPDEIIKLFADLDYICVALSKKEPGTGYILEHMLDTTEETNFLFVPAEKVKQVRKILSF